MDYQLKQRLVGAAVIVALAVLVLPLLFDGAGLQQPPSVEFSIPPRPVTSTPAPVEPAPLPVAPPRVADPIAEPTGWIVQLGSFREQGNALGLRDKLRAAGFPAFILRVEEGATPAYRVRVGPEQKKANAESLLERLAAAGHEGILLQYP